MTLIEMLISMLLSVFVLSTVGYVYVAQKLGERQRGAVGGLQDGARFGLDALRRDLLQAGYVGCNSNLQRTATKLVTETAVIPLNGTVDNFTIDATNAVRIFDAASAANVWGGTRPADAVAGTHVIEVRYASSDTASYLNAAVPVNGQTLTTIGAVNLGVGDESPSSSNRMALLSDCASAMVVAVVSTAANVATVDPLRPVTSANCQHASRVGASCFYWPATMLMPIYVAQYYIAELGTATAPRRGLFVRKRVMTLNGWAWNTPVQVAEGLNALTVFTAGLDGVGDPTWRVQQEVSGFNAVSNLTAAERGRLVRLDVRLAMRADGAAATQAKPVIRNFETSFTVRSRAAPE